MKSFLELFTRNWGMKLLALVLALTVFYSLRESGGRNGADRGLFLKGAETGGPVR